jgi:hypothetical protein
MKRSRRVTMRVAIGAAALVIVGLILWQSVDVSEPPGPRPLPAGAKVALAEVEPVVGAEAVTREGNADVSVECPAGGSGARAVEYDVAGEFSLFTAQARRDGSGSGARIEVLVDGDPRNGQNTDLRQAIDLNVPIDGARKLAFRISCDNPEDHVTIGAGTLHRRT